MCTHSSGLDLAFVFISMRVFTCITNTQKQTNAVVCTRKYKTKRENQTKIQLKSYNNRALKVFLWARYLSLSFFLSHSHFFCFLSFFSFFYIHTCTLCYKRNGTKMTNRVKNIACRQNISHSHTTESNIWNWRHNFVRFAYTQRMH